MYTAEAGYYTNLPRSLVFSYALRCPRRAAPEKPVAHMGVARSRSS